MEKTKSIDIKSQIKLLQYGHPGATYMIVVIFLRTCSRHEYSGDVCSHFKLNNNQSINHYIRLTLYS
jgi:hypothetical protein